MRSVLVRGVCRGSGRQHSAHTTSPLSCLVQDCSGWYGSGFNVGSSRSEPHRSGCVYDHIRRRRRQHVLMDGGGNIKRTVKQHLCAASGLVAGLVAITPAGNIVDINGCHHRGSGRCNMCVRCRVEIPSGYDDSLTDVVGCIWSAYFVYCLLIGVVASDTAPAG